MTPAVPDTGEHLIIVTDEHWVRYVVPVLIAILLLTTALLLFFLAGLSAHHNMWLSHGTFAAGMLLFLLVFHWFFMMQLSGSLDRIIITNRRLIRVQYVMIFQEDILEISFEKMKTVDAVKQGFFQNLLHYGTLFFESKLASVPLVRHPNHVAKIIQEAMHEKK